MTAGIVQQSTISTAILDRWTQVTRKLEALADALPEDTYEYTPVEGVRTVGDVLRHVAFWNRYVADAARGRQADGDANELPREQFATKAQILDALSSSADDAAAALKGKGDGLNVETAEMAVTFIEHTCEHYGQLVVFARLNGIVPPSSRV